MSHRVWFALSVLVGAASAVIAGVAFAAGHPLYACWNLFNTALMGVCASQIGWSNE